MTGSFIPPHRQPPRRRGLITGLFLPLFLFMFLSCVESAEIRQTQYLYYRGERLSEIAKPQFVICDDCPPVTKLAKSPKNPLEGIGIKWGTIGGEKSGEKVASNVKDNKETVSHRKDEKKLPEKEYKLWQETILFDLNSFKLTDSEQDHLDRIARESTEVVSITGYTCNIGSDSYNLRLSERRAMTVANYLKEKGLSVGSIEGKGKCCPVSEEKRLNRRVELTLKKEVEQK